MSGALRITLGRARTLAVLRALDLQLRRRGGRLLAEVDPTARIAGPIELSLLGEGEGPWELSLELGPNASLGRGIGIILARGRSTIRAAEGAGLRTGVRFRISSGEVDVGPRAHVLENTRFQVAGRLHIGSQVLVGFGCHLYCEERVELHENSGLAHGVTVIDHDHAVDGGDAWWAHQPLAIDPVLIGRNTIVSAGARVLRGARLGRNSVVGANAVVRAGEYPDRSVLVGSPARVVKTLG